jgi:hypothetical protein
MKGRDERGAGRKVTVTEEEDEEDSAKVQS